MIGDLLWLLGGVLLTVACGAVAQLRGRAPTQPKPNWVVATQPGNTYYTRWDASDVVVKVVPRVGQGTGFVVGSVRPTDERYEERVSELQAQAEEQAVALQATGVR